jgi:hypothetical protein
MQSRSTSPNLCMTRVAVMPAAEMKALQCVSTTSAQQVSGGGVTDVELLTACHRRKNILPILGQPMGTRRFVIAAQGCLCSGVRYT